MQSSSERERQAVLRVIWELQQEADISAAALAREAGLGRLYVQRRLRGEVDFSLHDLLALAGPLGVTYEDIAARTAHVLHDLG
jgi:transcriptional regulator with XRE-family HTH domain